MTSIWDMKSAISDARETLNAADNVACQIAPLLQGRLRHCYTSDVEALKRELRDFNIHTGKWKDI